MKSTQSEDLPKDLLGNLRISPQTRGFHDKIDEKKRNKENWPDTDLCAQICVHIYGPTERSSSQKHQSEWKWDKQRLCKRQPLNVTLTLRQKEMNEPSDLLEDLTK